MYEEGKYEGGIRVGDWNIHVIEDKTDKKILSEKLSYSGDVREGGFIYYYPNGEDAQVGTYHNGKMEGAVTIFYTGGNVFGKQFYVEGAKNGDQYHFYGSGKPNFTIQYKTDRPVANMKRGMKTGT